MRYLIPLLLWAFSATAQDISDPTLAVNASGINDWSTSVPFIDLMKQSRPFFADGCNHACLLDGGHLDSEGWPVSSPGGNIQTVWDMDSGVTAYFQAKTYRMEWEGNGSIVTTGLNIISSGSNFMEFTIQGSTFSVQIVSTDPEPNNVKNITIIQDAHQTAYDAGHRISPDYVEFLKDMRLIRFMDWGQTNWSQKVDWSDRSKVDDITFSSLGRDEFDPTVGVPYEYMVELANAVGADAWFNIPEAATDDYVLQMATYIRDNLNKTAHFELSNEVWNYTFPAPHAFMAMGQQWWPSRSPDFQLMLTAYARRSVEVFQVVDQVYAGRLEGRVNVLGGMMDDNTWVNEQVLEATIWQEEEPSDYIRPADVAQAIAVTGYFSQKPPVQDTVSAYQNGTSDVFLRDWMLVNSVPWLVNALEMNGQAANSAGVDFLMYEGGQHFLHGAQSSGDELAALLQFMRSDEVADVYEAVFLEWATNPDIDSDGPFMQFADIGGWSHWGAWTMGEYAGDIAPFGERLLALSASTSNWWGGTGDYSNSNPAPPDPVPDPDPTPDPDPVPEPTHTITIDIPITVTVNGEGDVTVE